MPNFFCGSLVVVRCGPQGLSVLFDRPGDRTAAVAAGYSYLLVSKGSAKIIRMSLSREQPPARVERAQQEQDYAASRSGHAGCRLFLFRCKRECGLFSPRFAANDSPVEDCDQYFLRPNSIWKSPRQGAVPGPPFPQNQSLFSALEPDLRLLVWWSREKSLPLKVICSNR